MNRAGVLAKVEREHGDEWRATVYGPRGRRLAVVLGSLAYVERALVALGLAPPIASLVEDRDRSELALVSSKPADGSA